MIWHSHATLWRGCRSPRPRDNLDRFVPKQTDFSTPLRNIVPLPNRILQLFIASSICEPDCPSTTKIISNVS